MLNLLVLKLINHLTAKSKGLWWGTKYLFLIFTSPKGGDCRNWLSILKLLKSGDRKNFTEP